jgi:hypothetical protein
VAAGGRGFDGTAAASHAAGVKVSLLIDAWHHNALAAEVTAIQATLGPNLANISTGGISSSTYNWAAQTPGGSLIVGNNVITLAPVPLGVNGTNTDHWLYISGGTGAAEAVLITGGSAVSGQASGTLIVNCGNAHSGAWTIRSATAGIQEALNSLPVEGGTIQVSAGALSIAGPIKVAVQGVRICGVGRNYGSSYLERKSGVLFNVTAYDVEITSLVMRGGAHDGIGAPAGNIAIAINGGRSHLHDLNIDLFYGGIQMTGGYHNKFANIWGRNCTGYLIKHSGGVSPFIDMVNYAGDPSYAVASEGGIVINASGAYIYNVDILYCNHGIVVQPLTERVEWTFIYDSRFDQNYTSGVYLFNGSAHALEGVFLHDVWSVSSGMTPTMGGATPTSGSGLVIITAGSGTIKNVNVAGGQIFNSNEHNIKIHAGQDIKIDGVWLGWCNAGNKPNIDDILADTPGRCEIVNCTIGSNQAGAAAVRSGILAGGSAGDLVVRDCRFITDNGAFTSDPIMNLASVPAAVKIAGANPGLDDVPGVVPSAATLTLAPRGYFHITGTTNINTILPVWQGRTLRVHNPDVGSWQLTSSGNIAGPATVASGESAILTFIGTKWLVGK